MHMDVDGAGPQQTSSSVAAAAGSGRGVLQKVAIAVAPVQAGMQKTGVNVGVPSFFFFLQISSHLLWCKYADTNLACRPTPPCSLPYTHVYHRPQTWL